MAMARQARSGWPRWRKEQARPMHMSTTLAAPPIASASGSAPWAAARTSIRNKPWPMPASTVKKMTDHAGCMTQNSCASRIRRGRYWFAGLVSHSGISE